MKLKIDWSDEQNRIRSGFRMRRMIRRAVLATLRSEKFGFDTRVSVTLTDNEGIRRKNLEFRGIDAPTDVLSFPMYDIRNGDLPLPGEAFCELGDIVLSLERAREQAETYGHGLEREVSFLTVHSVLHLLGYDHEISPDEEMTMRKRQRDIMKELGLEIRDNEPDERKDDK